MSGSHVFVLSIIAIVMFAWVMRAYVRQQNRKIPVDPDLDDAMAKIEQLEERIRVLERIITENQYDLKREIDSL
jgi:hypothetical protein